MDFVNMLDNLFLGNKTDDMIGKFSTQVLDTFVFVLEPCAITLV